MRLELTGRNVDITPALRRLLDAKLGKLDRLLNDSAVSAQAVLTREKYRHRTDITLHARGEKFLHGVGDSSAWEPSIAAAIEKLTQQAQKVKGKWRARKRHGAGKGEPMAGEEPEAMRVQPAPPRRAPRVSSRVPPILRTVRQPTVRTMSVADAARQIGGDGVLVFRDAETSSISVVVRGGNGDLTLVETGR